MSDAVATAAIAGAAATFGAAVPTITSYLAARADRTKAEQARGFERDRDWERYQTGLRQCYRKLLDHIEDVELTDDGLISSDAIGELRSNYYEAYFAADQSIAELLERFWSQADRNARRPPETEVGQELLRAHVGADEALAQRARGAGPSRSAGS